MRDPKRIERIINLVNDIWTKNPDLRLMQLLINAIGTNNSYYKEDELLENKLKEYYTEKPNKHITALDALNYLLNGEIIYQWYEKHSFYRIDEDGFFRCYLVKTDWKDALKNMDSWEYGAMNFNTDALKYTTFISLKDVEAW